MSQDLSPGGDAGTPPDQQQQSVQRTGAGAGTAMEAMLKKRRMQTREPDPAPAAPQATEPPDAGKTPPGK